MPKKKEKGVKADHKADQKKEAEKREGLAQLEGGGEVGAGPGQGGRETTGTGPEKANQEITGPGRDQEIEGLEMLDLERSQEREEEREEEVETEENTWMCLKYESFALFNFKFS